MGITIDKKKTEINLEYYYKNKPVQPSYNNNCTYKLWVKQMLLLAALKIF